MEIGKFLSKDLVGHSLSFLLVWTLISRALKQAQKKILKQEQEEPLILRAFKQAQKKISQLKPCGICMENKPIEKMFKSRNCSHSFCEDCVARFLAVKIQEKKATIKCPDPNCNSNFDPQQCISIIPKDVFERWGDALVDSMFGSKKIYCPFKDCSAMLVNDGNEVVRITECPHCHRLFCAQCQVPWHAEVDCREFQILKKGGLRKDLDLMALELAKKKKWKRCPRCNFYVEKTVDVITLDAGVVINFAMAVDPNGKIISMNVHRYPDTICDVNTNLANKNCTASQNARNWWKIFWLFYLFYGEQQFMVTLPYDCLLNIFRSA